LLDVHRSRRRAWLDEPVELARGGAEQTMRRDRAAVVPVAGVALVDDEPPDALEDRVLRLVDADLCPVGELGAVLARPRRSSDLCSKSPGCAPGTSLCPVRSTSRRTSAPSALCCELELGPSPW
jgi:hypothetical protein